MDTRLIRYTLLLFVLLFAPALPAFAAGQFSQSSGPADEATAEDQNRAIVNRIYDEVFNQDNTATAYALLATNLVQHDEGAVDGPDGQLALFDNLRSNMPGVVATIKHMAAEGDLVAVHWQASATPDDEFSGLAVIDLWRLTDGVVVEHWDGIQPVPASSASGNSMFSDAYVYPQGAPVISESDEEAERQMVVSAYLDIDNNQNLQTIERTVDSRYLQHNPNTASGLPAFIAHVQSLRPDVVGPRLTILNSLADQDLVFTIRNGGSNSIAADIWRVVDGKILEHWDVIPPRPTR